MHLTVCGVNYQDTPIAIREHLTVANKDLLATLKNLQVTDWVNEVYILSTCNRTEIYIIASQDTEVAILNWISEHWHLEIDIANYLYTHKDQLALAHLLRVASGLESMMQGESQILGQIKAAYALASEAGSIGKYLNLILQYTIRTAKEIRHTTDININATSLPYVAIKLAKRKFTEIENARIMLIGAGETNKLMAAYLAVIGVSNIIIANRSLAAAQEIAASNKHTQAILLGDIPAHLPNTDIVIAATSSGSILLDKTSIEQAMYHHKGELFLLDLSVPRNIDPQVSKLDKIHLYHMDDLNLLIQDNINLKAKSVNQAEILIATTAKQIKLELNALDATAAIQSYKQHNQNIANTLLTSAYKELEQAKDAKEIIDKFAHQLTNKLSHDIYILLKQAAKISNKELLQLIDDLLIKQPASNLEQ